MDRTERLYRIEQLLAARRIVPLSTFLETLEVSLATFKRDLEYLRDRMNAPIVWDRDAGGYRFDTSATAQKHELPGLWLNASEIHALLSMQQLLKELQPGLLAPHVEPLSARLEALLGNENIPAAQVAERIRIQRIAARVDTSAQFAPVASATLARRRLAITHYSRERDEESERTVSPQRLTYYRENWYLAAWCHLRSGLRSFSLDAIRQARLLDEPADEVATEELDALLGSAYGIFSGTEVEWAELLFEPERARWVAAERWHAQQRQTWLPDGRLLLEVPFADPRELAMDIQRHVPEVEIRGPASLRERVLEQLRQGLARLQA
ncbi:WYL domain-containing protein [Niveibacterium sp. SC-1]|uniref:helix-turn-helix transcriptional regulator n=1 Tax=Niveibacterium sp. SC-1 TaxID=3135646 RepID=UPI00311D879B